MTFVWVYGLSLGGYSYTLKMFVYQKVRARNFARAWGYLRCVQALPQLLGVPLAAHINLGLGSRAGYYFSAAAVLLATLALGLVDLHKKRLRQKRRLRKMRSNRSGDLALSCGAEDAEKQLKEAKVEMKDCSQIFFYLLPVHLCQVGIQYSHTSVLFLSQNQNPSLFDSG